MNWFLSEFNIQAWRMIRNYQPEQAPDVTLIYGPRGIGKSTMLSYLYDHVGQNERSIFTDALSFSRQYVYAAQDNKLKLFRQRYRTLRLLLIDDLQLLEGKAKSIEELHYTYEYVVGNGGKIVITLEANSPQMEFLGKGLASRFMSGLVVPVNRPLIDEMVSFLDEYIHIKRLFVDELVLAVIARKIDNLADAMKTLEQFIQFAESEQNELNLECFQAYWENKREKCKLVAEPMTVIRAVSQRMEVPISDIIGPSRRPKVNEARQLAIYAIRSLCQLSFPQIASYFNRQHSAIIASYKKMHERLARDCELREKYKIIIKAFKA